MILFPTILHLAESVQIFGWIWLISSAVAASDFDDERENKCPTISNNLNNRCSYKIWDAQHQCSDLPAQCIHCNYTWDSCVYGKIITVECRPVETSYTLFNGAEGPTCIGKQVFHKDAHCRFCYQLEPHQYTCRKNTSCRVSAAPPDNYYTTNCTANSNVICLGSRHFNKRLRCNWTSGYRWSTALILSITLGGFGVDRFYLGLWREGIGKLFSFGGIGVWTIVDVILIAIGYIGPHDGSLYV